jgi:hypothetical protein
MWIAEGRSSGAPLGCSIYLMGNLGCDFMGCESGDEVDTPIWILRATEMGSGFPRAGISARWYRPRAICSRNQGSRKNKANRNKGELQKILEPMGNFVEKVLTNDYCLKPENTKPSKTKKGQSTDREKQARPARGSGRI